MHAFDVEKCIKHTRMYDTYPTLVVCSMFTPNYDKVAVLKRSCEKHGISHILCEVPYIHDSKSANNSRKHQFEFTHPNFVYHVIKYVCDKYATVGVCLYVDADMYFRNPPKMDLLSSTHDIIVYNWAGDPERKESRCVYNPTYLKCSGGVYGCNVKSRHYENILRTWHHYIWLFATVVNADTITAADDQILDLVWNNHLIPEHHLIQPLWLSKQYLRLPFWPWVNPIIKHPCPVTPGRFRPVPVFRTEDNRLLYAFPSHIRGVTIPSTTIEREPFHEAKHIEDQIH